ncbi:enoyl-CoA hydratase/isomerase family protein [Ruegeria litorea]|uniref:Enoyl-CoA hydratase/isomerase family protein n=1 Tax=Falsiruegeria litorea TaxID=1280831 RepID=A0ABS5WKC5_9RHOB|nr:enoyl-CoA hydratase-related protein [Falsiruegeria litorea]MBT3139500.1 enoyl-CoA hydratase/isomerase family protein [Falsiruegeria litorea]
MSENFSITRHGRVALVTLTRPKQLNALNSTLAAELIAELAPLDRAPDIGCFVQTGSDRAFAAGADIKEMSEKSYGDMSGMDFFAEWEVFAKFRSPKIAAVRGFALGGGCELAMMCDYILAGESAKFGQPEIKLGVIAGIGGTQRMTKLIGRAKSMQMHLTGRMMDAQEALDCGLVAQVHPDEQVLEAALQDAATIAGYAKPVAMFAREAVHRAEELPLAEGLLWERRVFHSLFGTHAQREGMAAFLEKRDPDFRKD